MSTLATLASTARVCTPGTTTVSILLLTGTPCPASRTVSRRARARAKPVDATGKHADDAIAVRQFNERADDEPRDAEIANDA